MPGCDHVIDELADIDFAIREAAGGWIIVAAGQSKEEPDELVMNLHVFATEEAACQFLLRQMVWRKQEANKYRFDKGDDYEGSADAVVKPPKMPLQRKQ